MDNTTSFQMLGNLSHAASNGRPISMQHAMQIPSLGRLLCFVPLSSDRIFSQEKQFYSSLLLTTPKQHKTDIFDDNLKATLVKDAIWITYSLVPCFSFFYYYLIVSVQSIFQNLDYALNICIFIQSICWMHLLLNASLVSLKCCFSFCSTLILSSCF